MQESFENIVDEDVEAVRGIIEKKSIESYFQPLVSLKNGRIIGMEALSRGVWRGEIVMPLQLFAAAEKSGQRLALDRLCRDKAFSAFGAAKCREWLLFVNIDASILTEGVVGSDYLLESVNQKGIAAERVVIEISEACNHSRGMLERFIDQYRRRGFMIALDDVGIGDSNFARILMAKPDVIKIDRCMVHNLLQDAYKKEMFLSLVTLAQRVGAVTVAEGVESDEEALAVCELGADYAQGYYYSRPQPASETATFADLNEKMKIAAARYHSYKIRKTAEFYRCLDAQERTVKELAARIAECPAEEITSLLRSMLRDPAIECLYVLDSQGRQITDSICEVRGFGTKSLFQPDPKGSDQSAKVYCLHILAGRDFYISDPYLSMATGRLNRTMSCRIHTENKNEYILCVDFYQND